MIEFNCPRCKEKLEAPVSIAGEILQCPTCNHTTKVPPLVLHPSEAPKQKTLTQYIQDNLLPDEHVIYQTQIHWFIYIPSLSLLMFGLILCCIPISDNDITPKVFGFLTLSIATIAIIGAYFTRKSTELAITSKRIISKVGLISRKSSELKLEKVEGIIVDQGIFGRLFDFGTLIINGTGGGKTKFSNIVDPLNFRKNAFEAIDKLA